MAKESSFFEKLKKGMGIEGPVEERIEEVEKKPRMKRVKKPRELKIKTKPVGPKVEVKEVEVSQPVTEEDYHPPAAPEEKVEIKKEKWFEPEGQLAIDVYQTKNELVIQSAIAGVKPENLDISMEGDVLTIRGCREKPSEDATPPTAPENYFAQECYWGPFSREVILPVEVDPGRVEATMKEGILTIRIPKILRERKRKISVRG